MKNALIVVDVQKDFVEGGALGVEGGQQVADALFRGVLPVYEALGSLVMFTKDWHIDPGDHFSDTPDYIDSWPQHCVAESEGASFARDFTTVMEGSQNVFMKGQYAASYSGVDGINPQGEGLVGALKYFEVDSVDVVGIAFDYCVKATAIDLAKLGFNVNVIMDFTASVHPENDDQTIRELEDAGVTVFQGKHYVERFNND